MENIVVMDVDQAEANQLAITPGILKDFIGRIPDKAEIVVFGNSESSDTKDHWFKNVFKIDFNNGGEKQPVLCFGSFNMGKAITFGDLIKFIYEKQLEESQRIILDCSNKSFHDGTEIVSAVYYSEKTQLMLYV